MSTAISINYVKKSQAILFTPIDGLTQEPLSDELVLYLGDFLATTGITAEDCAGALLTYKNTKSKVPRVNEWDMQQIKALPDDMSGKTVLDIGGYDGYVSSACLERGAKRAVVIDNLQHQRYTLPDYPYGWGSPRKYDGVEYIMGDLMDFSTWMDYTNIGDIVLCLNVIYHVANPLEAIQRLRILTKGELYISSSVTDDINPDWRWVFDETRQMFFTPSRSGLRSVLEGVGFSNVEEMFDDGKEVMYRCI